ncbi:hypothetical protein LTR72_009450 [Exophiala xenobiotica]|nr:hypothetical protein LTR72_009450 [Exophiala xenobiotica]KAK5259229.1 hypothetical protein LTR40_006363 [Exophiala xenobiotica]KAK5291935.1 hypothetical protein LTR14_005484 [Exophiala xenobiotica]KAK5329544.1 hypothetical protein LTR93_001131 [Exophiala xenobiotica]KAK5367050.1 hypothetical protein LTS13_007903 [Exophiala xenobiotica]
MKLSTSPLLLAAFAFSAYAAPSDPSANQLNHLEQRQRGGGDSWTSCDNQNLDNPYTTANGKQFYYNCNWQYQTKPSGFLDLYTGRTFRGCIDDCSLVPACQGIHWEQSSKDCWHFKEIVKQKFSDVTPSNLARGIDSAILV